MAVPAGMTHFNCACTNPTAVLQLDPTLSVAQWCIVWVCEVWKISNIVFVGLGRAKRNVRAKRAVINPGFRKSVMGDHGHLKLF